MTRNMEDLWRQVFSVGTEWEAMDEIYGSNWDFSNLENAFEEGGELLGQNVYLFGCTETQGIADASLVPVVVAVVSRFAPSDKIAIVSVQRANEQIWPMKRLKMDWYPYIPLGRRDAKVEDLKSCRVFILRCKQRKVGLKQLGIDRAKEYDYCLPHFYNPFKKDEDDQQESEVQILFSRESEPPLICSFDWELDVLDELIEQEALAADEKDAFKDFVKEKVREAKKVQREAREAKEKMLQEMGDETRAAFDSIRFYKFYPVSLPGSPEIAKSSFINRAYDSEVFLLFSKFGR
nr:protein HEAT INTOLERANT 4-like [Coffea arabica]